MIGLVETGISRSSIDRPIVSVVGPNSALIVRGRVSIGPGTRIDCAGGTLEIGNGTSITCNVTIICHGSVRVGSGCAFADGVLIRDSDGHACSTASAPGSPVKAVIVGDRVWLGSRVIVLKGVSIGAGAIVAAGAVVSKDLPPASLAGGIPAQVIRETATWK